MAKYNHSKLKNTYLIFEFLIRQLTNEMITESNPKKSPMYSIIKEYFNKGVLNEELKLYQALVNNHIPKEYTADKLIDECVRRYQGINKKKLDKERYKLIGEVKKKYDLNKLFSVKVNDYKEAGNVFFLFESIRNGDIVEKSKQQGMIMENITSPKEKDKSMKIFESIKKASPENRELAYMILIERFNKKYGSSLNQYQKKYIRDYIYNNNDLKGWVNEHIKNIKKEVGSYVKMLNEGNEQDQILSLKVNECVSKINYLRKKKIMDKEDHFKIIQSYKLLEQLEDLNNV